MTTTPNNTARRANGRSRSRGYANWRPQAKTRALLDDVFAVFEIYENFRPLTLRQVFYKLVADYGYEKTQSAYDRLSDHLVRARRARLIPFDWMRDDGVVTMHSRWHEDPDDFWDDVGTQIRDYRRNRQAGQAQHVELWCESAGMVPQLAQIADAFSVPVYSSGGQPSLTAVRQIAARALDRSVPTLLLHVGDFDPSGDGIFSSISQDAAAFVRSDRVIQTQEILAVRLALTAEQVAEYSLPTAPPKQTDSRTAKWGGTETAQLEALPPDILASIVKGEIASCIDESRFSMEIEAEDQDRAELYLGLPAAGGTS